MQTITINSISYPCFPTMGAIVRFRDLTGREITEIKRGVRRVSLSLLRRPLRLPPHQHPL